MAREDYSTRVLVVLGPGHYKPGWIREPEIIARLLDKPVRICYGRHKEGRIGTVNTDKLRFADKNWRIK